MIPQDNHPEVNFIGLLIGPRYVGFLFRDQYVLKFPTILLSNTIMCHCCLQYAEKK